MPKLRTKEMPDKILFTVLKEDRKFIAQIEATIMRRDGIKDHLQVKHSDVIRYALRRAAEADRRRPCLKSQ